MKKLLSILGAMTLIGTTSTSVVACGRGDKPSPTPYTRIDLSGLSDNVQITLSSSTQTVADFKTALLIELKKESKFDKLSDTEVDITKSDSTQIQNSDIVDNSTFVTKVKTKSTSTNFTGEKNINVTIKITDTRTDISTKIPNDINLGQLSTNSVKAFLANLQAELVKISELNTITSSDYDIYKAGTTTGIQDSDISAGTSLNIKIVAKGNKFTGEKDNITVNYIQKNTLNIEVGKQLKLTNDKGEAVQTATLDLTVKNNVNWTVEALKKRINASQLLRTENKAANQACFDFITNVLKVKPKEGTTFADGVFDKAVLDAITAEVTNIKPELTKMDDGKDYAITGGTFNFQFKKDEEALGDVYGIKLKADKTKGVIATALTAIAGKIAVADTDVVTNSNILFVKDGPIPKGAKKGAAINIVGMTGSGKQFMALNKITGLNIIAQFDNRTLGTHWNRGDWLKISYKNTDVNFDPSKTFTKFTIR